MEVVLLERVAKLGQMGEVVRVRDGFAPVLELAAHREPATRLAIAVAPVTVVERQRGKSRGGEALGVSGDAIASSQRAAGAHDHARDRFRATIRPVERAGAAHPTGHETDLTALHDARLLIDRAC